MLSNTVVRMMLTERVGWDYCSSHSIQYYTFYRGNRYVDLGLQTHKVKARVHQHFRWDYSAVNLILLPVSTLSVSTGVFTMLLLFLSSHTTWRLIMIAEKDTVYKEFPPPLINRMEKHLVLYSSVLEEWQLDTLKRLEKWIMNFSHISKWAGSELL